MLFNKNTYRKTNDKKLLHKIGKRWVTVSIAILALIGGSALATTSIHADSINVGLTPVKQMAQPTSANHNISQQSSANSNMSSKNSAFSGGTSSLSVSNSSVSQPINNESNSTNSVKSASNSVNSVASQSTTPQISDFNRHALGASNNVQLKSTPPHLNLRSTNLQDSNNHISSPYYLQIYGQQGNQSHIPLGGTQVTFNGNTTQDVSSNVSQYLSNNTNYRLNQSTPVNVNVPNVPIINRTKSDNFGYTDPSTIIPRNVPYATLHIDNKDRDTDMNANSTPTVNNNLQQANSWNIYVAPTYNSEAQELRDYASNYASNYAFNHPNKTSNEVAHEVAHETEEHLLNDPHHKYNQLTLLVTGNFSNYKPRTLEVPQQGLINGQKPTRNIKDYTGSFQTYPLNSLFGDMSSNEIHDLSKRTDTILLGNMIDLKSMKNMFYNMPNLQHVYDLNGIDTSNVTNMENLFDGDSNLQEDQGFKKTLSAFNTHNVNNMQNMFENDMNLSDLSPMANWDTSNVTNMDSMFAHCPYITDLTPLQNWDTHNVTDFSTMFQADNGLLNNSQVSQGITDITPLANWDTSSAMSTRGMFQGTNITKSRNWTPNNDIWDVTKTNYQNFNATRKLINSFNAPNITQDSKYESIEIRPYMPTRSNNNPANRSYDRDTIVYPDGFQEDVPGLDGSNIQVPLLDTSFGSMNIQGGYDGPATFHNLYGPTVNFIHNNGTHYVASPNYLTVTVPVTGPVSGAPIKPASLTNTASNQYPYPKGPLGPMPQSYETVQQAEQASINANREIATASANASNAIASLQSSASNYASAQIESLSNSDKEASIATNQSIAIASKNASNAIASLQSSASNYENTQITSLSSSTVSTIDEANQNNAKRAKDLNNQINNDNKQLNNKVSSLQTTQSNDFNLTNNKINNLSTNISKNAMKELNDYKALTANINRNSKAINTNAYNLNKDNQRLQQLINSDDQKESNKIKKVTNDMINRLNKLKQNVRKDRMSLKRNLLSKIGKKANTSTLARVRVSLNKASTNISELQNNLRAIQFSLSLKADSSQLMHDEQRVTNDEAELRDNTNNVLLYGSDMTQNVAKINKELKAMNTQPFKPFYGITSKRAPLFTVHNNDVIFTKVKATKNSSFYVKGIHQIGDHKYYIVSHVHKQYLIPMNKLTNMYWQKNDLKHKHHILVIKKTHQYKNKHFTRLGKRIIHKGSILAIKRIITISSHHKMTRFQLRNGKWITANKKFIKII